jgi:hypothetical protein
MPNYLFCFDKKVENNGMAIKFGPFLSFMNQSPIYSSNNWITNPTINFKIYKLMILWSKISTKIHQIDDKITKLD